VSAVSFKILVEYLSVERVPGHFDHNQKDRHTIKGKNHESRDLSRFSELSNAWEESNEGDHVE